MTRFLQQLKKESLKYFSKEETKEVLDYYEEIINERVATGENLDSVLKEYNTKDIIKEMAPEIIIKRELKERKDVTMSAWHLLLILFSIPILIPLAILYLALLVVIFSLIITGISLSVAAIISTVPYIIEVIIQTNTIEGALGLIGIGLIAFSLLFLIGLFILHGSYLLSKTMIKGVSGFLVKRRNKV